MPVTRAAKKAEAEDAPVHAQIKEAQRNVGRDVDGHEREGGPTGKNEAEDSSEHRKQNGFCKELTDHAAAGGTECRARSELFSAAVGARED